MISTHEDIASRMVGAAMVVIVWQLDLQLPVQSVPISPLKL